MVIGFGGIGGIIASVAFREQDAPTYVPGLWTAIASQFLIIAVVLTCTAYFAYRNHQVRRGMSSKAIEGTPGFLYTL